MTNNELELELTLVKKELKYLNKRINELEAEIHRLKYLSKEIRYINPINPDVYKE